MPVVETASLHAQTLADAPASVTVITAEDIRKYGYRTLGDVLASARGFTVASNRISQSSGVRGFAVPGDYNTCFLVMINGHPMTEIAADSNGFFGQDFGLDLDIVERIEIIRGPSSALYGSNGILATINLITKTPAESPHWSASTETGFGAEQKAVLMGSFDLGRGANLLVEGSGFYTGGQNLLLPGLDSLAPNDGVANHVDAQGGYHSFVNLQWGGWNFTSYFNNHRVRASILGDGTEFNDQGQFVQTARNFAGASYTHDYGNGGELRWQLFYDQMRYADRYDYLVNPGIVDNRDQVHGDWIDSQITYSDELPHIGLLTLGLSAKVELRDLVENADFQPDQNVNLSVNPTDRTLAPFVQQEWNLARNWTLYLGARFDVSHNYGSFLSPRAALVYRPTTRTSYKLVYGRPFRTPSVYEAYYADGISQLPNPALRPETAEAFEASAEHKIGKSAYALVNGYHYELDSVIQAVFISQAVLQYQNCGARRSDGVEFELGGHLKPWLETTASLTFDRTVDVLHHDDLPNAPGEMAKVRGAVPLFRDRIYFSTDFQYISARDTLSESSTRPVALLNATLSSKRLLRGFDFVAGVRNALNWGYADPIALPLDASVDQMPAYGRTAFLKVIWRQGE